jgi:putative multiple sugar transport system substrate-binding protein
VRKILSSLAAASLALTLAACGSEEQTGVKANMGAMIGISLPNTKSTRWVNDGNNMVEQFKAMGYNTSLKYGQDVVPDQVAQVEAMVAQGSKLLVIGAIDGLALKGALAKAAKAGIPVIAYDRLILDSPNVSYYASFDNYRVGIMQAQLLVDRLGLSKTKKGPFTVELFSGAADDNNANYFFRGAMEVLQPYMDNNKLVVKSGQSEYEKTTTERWSDEEARKRMKIILNAYYQNERVDAVLSPYDGMSRGIITALKSEGYTRRNMPVISGQDAEVESVAAIIKGEQTGTVYKDTRELAKVAVQMGNALLTGAKPLVNDTKSYNNGVKDVPSYLLNPVAVDKANYKTLLIKGNYYTEDQLKKELAKKAS